MNAFRAVDNEYKSTKPEVENLKTLHDCSGYRLFVVGESRKFEIRPLKWSLQLSLLISDLTFGVSSGCWYCLHSFFTTAF